MKKAEEFVSVLLSLDLMTLESPPPPPTPIPSEDRDKSGGAAYFAYLFFHAFSAHFIEILYPSYLRSGQVILTLRKSVVLQ